MKITNNFELKKYKKIIIASPIWVFSVCAPIRDFAYKYSDDIINAEYIFTHFMKTSFLKVKDELDTILELKETKLASICIRFGKIKSIKTY